MFRGKTVLPKARCSLLWGWGGRLIYLCIAACLEGGWSICWGENRGGLPGGFLTLGQNWESKGLFTLQREEGWGPEKWERGDSLGQSGFPGASCLQLPARGQHPCGAVRNAGSRAPLRSQRQLPQMVRLHCLWRLVELLACVAAQDSNLPLSLPAKETGRKVGCELDWGRSYN